ncbi:MAG: GTP-binding protein [Acidobacteria bacterium]|nr:GTP-binding protein [Acidobacteriota bacterium]
MIQKKVCMLGGFAVGKTSLVSRFVHSIFSDKYLTTLGVKIDKKAVDLGDRQVEFILWDIYGEDDFQKVRLSYLRGAAGYLLVVDGTRRETLDTALTLQQGVELAVGRLPFVVLVNKADLEDTWELNERALSKLSQRGWRVVKTSAKTGAGVQEAFAALARAVIDE